MTINKPTNTGRNAEQALNISAYVTFILQYFSKTALL